MFYVGELILGSAVWLDCRVACSVLHNRFKALFYCTDQNLFLRVPLGQMVYELVLKKSQCDN